MELNKIYNEDCFEGLKRLPDECVDFILTDPPYNINLQPQRRNTSSILNDSKGELEFISFLYPIAKEMNRVLKPDSFAVVFTGWSTSPLFRKIFESFWKLKSSPVWVKNNFGIGYYTRPQYEPALLFMKGNPPVLEKAVSDVWKFDRIQEPIHSCEKPLKLMKFIVEAFSKEEDVVLDPFVGVGASMVACKQLGRKYLGYEIEREYCEETLKRLRNTMRQRKLTLLEVQNESKRTVERSDEGQGKDELEGAVRSNTEAEVECESSPECVNIEE